MGGLASSFSAPAEPVIAKEYRTLRKRIGTQKHVSKVLGVTKNTLSDRERGVYRITREAELALRYVQQESEK